MNRSSTVLAAVAVAALLVAQAGCGSDAVSPESQDPYVVEALTPTSFVATVGSIASPAPSIRVTDRRTHKPVAGVHIEFVAGGATVANNNVVTNAAGIASPGEWTFGIRPGFSNLNVFLNGTRGVLSFAVQLRADAPAKLESLTQEGQVGLPGGTVSGPAVLVSDRFDNPIEGSRVEFVVTEGDGKLERSFILTGRDGDASSGKWTLGPNPRMNASTAQVSGVEPLEFIAQALDPATIKWYRLESIGGSDPSAWGINQARLGITAYDSCLCRKQEGYFIDQVTYSYFMNTETLSGSYVLDGPKLTLPASYADGLVDGTALVMTKVDPEWGDSVTWIYREIN